jgi:predicted RNase H-like HicB family nuclease
MARRHLKARHPSDSIKGDRFLGFKVMRPVSASHQRSQLIDAGGEHGEDGAREYFAVIVQEPDMTFHATFPDLPGCVATAATFDGARGAAGKALTRCLDDRKRAGDAIPEPSTLETIVGGEDEHCGAAILVREATRRPAPDV